MFAWHGDGKNERKKKGRAGKERWRERGKEGGRRKEEKASCEGGN